MSIHLCLLLTFLLGSPKLKLWGMGSPRGNSEEAVATLPGVLEILRLVWVRRKAAGSLHCGNVRFTFLGPGIKQTRVGSWLCDLGTVLNPFIQFVFQKWR